LVSIVFLGGTKRSIRGRASSNASTLAAPERWKRKRLKNVTAEGTFL
jgi:hypothetical protein